MDLSHSVNRGRIQQPELNMKPAPPKLVKTNYFTSSREALTTRKPWQPWYLGSAGMYSTSFLMNSALKWISSWVWSLKDQLVRLQLSFKFIKLIADIYIGRSFNWWVLICKIMNNICCDYTFFGTSNRIFYFFLCIYFFITLYVNDLKQWVYTSVWNFYFQLVKLMLILYVLGGVCYRWIP